MRIIFQLGIAVLSLVAIISVLRKQKEHFVGPMGALFWVVFWVAVVGTVSLPTELLDRISRVIGIGRGVDLVMYTSIALLFFLIFKLHIKIEKMQRDMTQVIRDKALKEIGEKK